MKLFIAISMIFLIISCSNEENTILQENIKKLESQYLNNEDDKNVNL